MATSAASSNDESGSVDSTGGSDASTDGGDDDDDSAGIPPLSPGCGMPFTDEWLADYRLYWDAPALRATVDVGDVEREFLIQLPEAYDPDLPYPIVFTFHGQGGQMDNAYGQDVARRWDGEVIAVYPQGIPSNGGSGPTTWNLSVGGYDESFFIAMLNEIGGRMCIDMQRVLVQGTSMGGMMTNFLACSRGDLVRGAGPTASMFTLSPDACKGPIPQFVIHGMNDNVVSFSAGVQVRDRWLAINGCSDVSTPVDPAPCVAYTECESDAPVIWCAHDGGHDTPNVAGLDEGLHAFLQGL
jgi:poly(3-hydroxybutyrate) depolymerase